MIQLIDDSILGAFKIENYAFDCIYLGAKNYLLHTIDLNNNTISTSAKMKGICKEGRNPD